MLSKGLSKGLSLAYALLALAACASTASSTGSTTSLKLYGSDQADGQYTGSSSSSSSSSTHSGSSSTHSGSSGTSSAGPERLLLGAQQQKCTQYAAQVNNHNRNGYKLAVQKYRNPQQCPAVCKMYESSVPSGVFRVQCNVASCTCTGTAVTSQAKVMFGITDAGRFSFTALYPPQCTAAMSAKCAGVYEWCRGC